MGEADVRGAYGGRGSGKTRSFAKMTAIRGYMWSMARREGIILCGRQFMNSLDESSLEEIKQAIKSEPWLLAHYEIGEKFVRTKDRRIEYKFVGLDRNIDSIKSKSRILLCWVDEAEPMTEEAWTKLIPTLREEDSELWVTWNPESQRSPVHRRFRLSKDKRTKIVELNWRDNPWFPSILDRTRLRDRAERPDSYAHIWDGDFAVVFEGAYYARQLLDARDEGRITKVAYDPALPVHTAWDLGISDSMVVWLWQATQGQIRVIDHIEDHGKKLEYYTRALDSLGYKYGVDWVPHDARVRELGSGLTRVETLKGLGRNPRVVTDHKVEDGINAVREILPRCWFDETQCADGLEALRNYRTEFDDNRDTFKPAPRHDWSSHSSDAFRYLAMAWREWAQEPEQKDPIAELIRPRTIAEVIEDTPYDD